MPKKTKRIKRLFKLNRSRSNDFNGDLNDNENSDDLLNKIIYYGLIFRNESLFELNSDKTNRATN